MATPTTEQVFEVSEVKLTIFKTHPPTLAIYAEGMVPTPGYTNPRLEPYIYIQPPTDGIWDFSFDADRPTVPVPDVLVPISATYYWFNYPRDLKGVRIHARVNSMEARLDETVALKELAS